MYQELFVWTSSLRFAHPRRCARVCVASVQCVALYSLKAGLQTMADSLFCVAVINLK